MKGGIVDYEEAADRCSSFLPGDLMVEILQRLPVISLLRFESVSKDWLHLITSPEFIKKHLIHRQLNNKNLYLHCHHHVPHCRTDISKLVLAHFAFGHKCCPDHHHRRGISLISKTEDNDQNNPFETSVMNYSLDYDHIRKDISIVGCSNGLVCFNFQLFRQSFGIWNPATRKLKLLPKLRTDYQREHVTGHGFSYVPSTGSYKLVRISTSYIKDKKKGNDDKEGYVTRVHVFNLGQDCWKKVLCHGLEEPSLELPAFYFYKKPVVVNGCLHWFGFGSTYRSSSSRSMVWFDMEKEVFVKKSATSYPFDDDFSFDKASYELTVFEENLAMFISPIHDNMFPSDEDEENNDICCQLWIYDDGAWKKRITFGPLPIGHHPIGFWGNRDIIIRPNQYINESKKKMIAYGLYAYCYNLYSKEKTNHPPCREMGCNLGFYPYVETLVQI